MTIAIVLSFQKVFQFLLTPFGLNQVLKYTLSFFFRLFEALAKLKELRSGDAYDAYNGEINKFAKITSISSGSTINRWNVSKGNDPISQLWQWNVNDPEIFVTEVYEIGKRIPSRRLPFHWINLSRSWHK